MSSDHPYGAYMHMYYDLEVEVRRTSPSEEMRKVEHVEEKNYVVLPGTDTVVDDELMPEGIGINGTPDDSYSGKAKPKPEDVVGELEDKKPGDTYTVRLNRKVFDVIEEIKDQDLPLDENRNFLFFKPGELEEKLETAKAEFAQALVGTGIEVDTNQIYLRI
tara:strand:+ start:89 stop:574 length:486 start_codon:yes stop_codon:yes gene_type:complete